ncbi:hypothetical protein FQA39_LY06832 [Lamprigera yunnana]|nr:hypothetical protein FQA39_LY06832 [Lamprigera yunnana]
MISVTLLCLSTRTVNSSSIRETVPMLSDGWRPIIGNSQLEIQDEITLYKNPTQTNENNEPIKAQLPSVFTPSPTQSTKPYQTITATQAAGATNKNNVNNGSKAQGKSNQHPKQPKPFHLSHGHGPHIPLTPLAYKGSPHRIPVPNKHMLHMVPRPIRDSHGGPAVSHNTRNEVILSAPSAAIGTFTFFNHPPGFPKKPFPVLHAPNDVFVQHIPVQTYLFQNRNPPPIEGNNFFNQNDEYTRNLVPPPFKEKSKPQKLKERPSVATETEATINNPTLVIGKHKDRIIPENIILQLPPTFEPTKFEIHPQKNPVRRPIEIQVTKEKLNVFHNSIPNNYNPVEPYEPFQDSKLFTYEIEEPVQQEIHPFKKPTEVVFEQNQNVYHKSSVAPQFPTYEVTEEKQWHASPQSIFSTRPSIMKTPTPNVQLPQPNLIFLPTPYRPESESLVPTSDTQSEISSIYSKLNNRNRQPTSEYPTDEATYFDIKEVSTHYPIVGKPENPTIFSIPMKYDKTEFPNTFEIVKEQKQNYQPVLEVETTTPPATSPPIRERQPQRGRPNNRRRRPSHRTTTEEPNPVTEEYSFTKSQNSEEQNYSYESQRPHRRKRPNRVRTTQYTTTSTTTEIPRVQTSTTKYRSRIKYEGNRIRPTSSSEIIDELPLNHKLTETISYSVMQPVRESFIDAEVTHSTENEAPTSFENEVTKVEVKPENFSTQTEVEDINKLHASKLDDVTIEDESDISAGVPTTTSTTTTTERNRIRQSSSTTTTKSPTTHVTAIEDHSFDQVEHFEPVKDTITIHEVYYKQTENVNIETATSPITTTTPEATTSNKIQRIRTRPLYENKNRPRFSVKEYRQRLNQLSSTSTETPSTSTELVRARFPNRSRKPPIQLQEEEITERTKFTPKEPRHGLIGEATVEKKVNTRLRPFGRQRTTTEASTTTQKISIKPNIFSNLRRPPHISLKQRVYTKHNRTNTQENNKSDDGESDLTSNTIQNKNNKVESGVEEENEYIANTEIMKNDVNLQSQRVSDLTSSAHKEYETPGLFKSVSPNTRIVPSYFKISTDDPILPIEAFFTNLKNVKNEP